MASASKADTTSQTLLRLARRVESCGFAEGLNPAQWAALRYFARANRFSRTVSAFASFHGSTRGTASQSVRSLVEKGLLLRRADPRDGRSASVEPSDEGWRALEHDPAATLAHAVSRLDVDGHAALSDALDALWASVAGEDDGGFGCCRDCTCLRRQDGSATCAMAGEPLALDELDRICVSFTRAACDRDGATGPSGSS